MHGRRALIVEDDPITQRALRALLKQLGFETELAPSVDEALAKLAWRPDCVVLDLMLRDANGVEVLRAIREKGLPIKVAVATGSLGLSPMNEVRALRPDAMFIKPIVPADLLSWLESIRDGARASRDDSIGENAAVP